MTTTVTVEENNISVNLSDGVSLSSAAATMAESLASSSGATLPGPLSFSGTTHRGIRLINLTTAERDLIVSPGAGAKIWNTTTGTEQAYNGSAWADVGGGASDVDDLTTNTAEAGQYMRVDLLDGQGIEYRDPSQVLTDIGAQPSNANLTAIAALAPSNDDVIQRKAGAWTNRTVAQYVTDILAGWAAHVVTFLQSASAADARAAILAADSRPTQTDIAGTTHTFTTANEGQIVASQSGSATVFTVPLNSAQAFTVGAIVGVERQGAGTLAITATSGVTLNGVDGASKSISTQWAAAALRKVGTNAWVIIGAIS